MDNIFQELPYAIIKINKYNEIIDLNDAAKDFLPHLGTNWLKSCLKAESTDRIMPGLGVKIGEACHFWVGKDNRVFFAHVFSLMGHEERLILVGEEPDFCTLLPGSLERLFEDFSSVPEEVARRIAALIQGALTFQRFDLLRVDPNQRKYVYEYSIGMDVVGVVHTAYRKVRNTGLSWLLDYQLPHLVSDFTIESFSFLEDHNFMLQVSALFCGCRLFLTIVWSEPFF